ncbi:MAG TPA: penicillin-binding protein 2 [Gammaproteobacteria bacterium]
MNRRRKAPALATWRSRLLLGLFVFAALALEARLVWLQLFESEFLSAEGDQRQQRVVEVPAHRGLVRDRHGEPLAVSTPVDNIIVDPQRIALERDHIYELAAALGMAGEELEREVTRRHDRQYYAVARRLAPAEAAPIIELGIPGVWSEREYKRFYPQAEVTCHLVGFAGDDDVGQEGLEYLFDARLAGENGSKRVLRDERGRFLADVEQIRPARAGRDIRASIDLRLQYLAYRALKAAVQEAGASSGSLVLLDVQTGEVLALANQPACNPNDPMQRARADLYRNRAITDPIEPGSTNKPLILAAALASGRYTPETVLDVPRVLEVAGRAVTDDEYGPHGAISVTEILARSSSVGLGLIGLDLEPLDMWSTLRAFGFGGPTDSELGSLESHGTLQHYSSWGKIGQATMSYGYGLSVTALQLARAYAAIAAGGLLPPVSFEALDEQPERTRIIDAGISADLLTMLEVVVSDQGTAQRADVPFYRVAGKTGTARVADSGSYSRNRYHAVFAGIAPVSEPRFAAVVIINDPRGRYYGGEVAAPVFAEVMRTALRTYGVPRDAAHEPTRVSLAEALR